MARNKELAKLFVTLGIDDKDFIKGTEKFQKTVKTWGKEMAVTGAAITAALGLATRAAMEEAIGVNRLSQALKNVGADYAALSVEIEKNIAATQAKSNYGDAEQREALAALVGVTGTYNGALEQLRIATDLAAAKGMDLVTAAELIGRVVNGDISMLKRYGVAVKEGSSATEALNQIQERFNGAAEAAANPLIQLKNAIGDLTEAVGSIFIPILRSLGEKIKPVISGLKEWIELNPVLSKIIGLTTGAAGSLLGTLGAIGMVIDPLAKGLRAVFTIIGFLHINVLGFIRIIVSLLSAIKLATAAQWLWNIALAANPIGLVVTAVAALAAGIYGLIQLFQKNKTEITENTLATREYSKEIENANQKISELNNNKERYKSYLEEEKKKLDDVKNSSAGYAEEISNLEHALGIANDKLDRAKEKLSGIQSSYKTASDRVKELENAISNVNRELEDLASPRLEGMQEFEDRIFGIEHSLRILQLQRNQLEAQGLDTELIEKQIETLRLEKENIELQRDIKYEPLLRQARETVESVTGQNVETAFNDVMTRIAALASNRRELENHLVVARAEMDAQNAALILQQATVTKIEAEAEKYEKRLKEIKLIVDEAIWQQQAQVYIQEKMISNLDKEIEKENERLRILKEQAAITAYESWPYRDSQGLILPPPAMDTGGLVKGPGAFRVGPGVVEVVRRYDGTSGAVSTSNVTQNFNISGLVVREEADIQRIARELYRMTQKRG